MSQSTGSTGKHGPVSADDRAFASMPGPGAPDNQDDLRSRIAEITEAASGLRRLLGYLEAHPGLGRALPSFECTDDLIDLGHMVTCDDSVATAVTRYLHRWHEEREYERRLAESRPLAEQALQFFRECRDDTSAGLADRAMAGYLASYVEEALEHLGGVIIDTHGETAPGMTRCPAPGWPSGASRRLDVLVREHEDRRYVLAVRAEGGLAAAFRLDQDQSLHPVQSGWPAGHSREWQALENLAADEQPAGPKGTRRLRAVS